MVEDCMVELIVVLFLEEWYKVVYKCIFEIRKYFLLSKLILINFCWLVWYFGMVGSF